MSSYPATIEEWIRSENNNQPSCQDQIFVAYWFLDREIFDSNNKPVRTSTVREEIQDQLGHKVRSVLDNLEGIGVLQQISPPGNGSYIRCHRTEENFYDPSKREFVTPLEEEISRFIDDLQTQEKNQPLPTPDGGKRSEEKPLETLRTVAARVLDVTPTEVEEKLTEPTNPIERMNRYDSAVKAIKESDEISRNGNYDEMGWRNMALKWELTQRAVRVEQNEAIQ